MRSGTLAETSALELFCQLTKDTETGVLDILDGKKKRSFYLSSGDLSFTRSNLKSESAKALKVKHPDLDNKALADLQANRRVMNAVGMTQGTWTFTEGEEPPKILPLNLLKALWDAMLERFDDERISALLSDFMDNHPEVNFAGRYDVSDLPIGPELGAMLHDLDGRRTLDEVLSFAPGEAGQASRAIYLSYAVGLTQLIGQGLTTEVKITEEEEPGPAPESMVSISFDDKRTDLDYTDDPTQQIPAHEVSLPGVGGPASGRRAGISSMIASALGDRASAQDPDTRRLQAELRRIGAAENHFEIIGVDWDATDEEYRRAYFELARRYHPDAWSEKPLEQVEKGEIIIAKINEAWEVLGGPEDRAAYIDSVIHGIKTEDEIAMEKVSAIFAAEERFKVGLRALSASKYVEANEIFQDIVDSVPEEHEFRAHLGYTIFRLNVGKDLDRAEEGRELIKGSVDAVAKMDKGWVLLGKTYAAEERFEIARRCFIKALQQNPSNPDARMEMKRLERAKDEVERKNRGFFKSLFGSKKKKKKNARKK
jgi:curved DNA-binding protein CbpA